MKKRTFAHAQAAQTAAFTLAELLTAVLVISVIMVAFAPVITKRMKDNVSVTTDNKKGLEIFANPGTYTFDVPIGINTLFLQGAGGGGGGAGASLSGEINVTKTSNSTWTVPKGVNQVTLKITGAGGGGGGANGASSGATSCENNPGSNGNPNDTELAKNPLFHALRISDDGSDLCIFKRNALDDGNWPYQNCDRQNLKAGQTCASMQCCWYAADSKYTSGSSNESTYPYSYSGKGRAVCTRSAGSNVCGCYGRTVASGPTYGYRLPTDGELQKIRKYLNEYSRNAGNNGLQLCSINYLTSEPNTVAQCSSAGTCIGAGWVNRCDAAFVWGSSGMFQWINPSSIGVIHPDQQYAGSIRCVKSLKYYNNYSGSGGSSGAVLEKTINVLPNDTFEITIGQGGAGGASKTKGGQGETTKIVHKRGGIELGTYYVKGGLGGNPATTSAHGSAYLNNTTSSGTTPQGTCYSRNRKDTSDSFTGGNTSCTTISYSGESGSSTKGGNGGRVKNEGSINNGEASSGGYLYVDSSRGANQRATNEEIRLAKGQNASTAGFGGGGGLTPAWANSTSHFYQGGKGANGKVEILYKMALPGSGGGSASRVGGVEESTNKDYEIKYKVSEGDRIVIEVGSGGSGGAPGQDGLSGTPTIVGDNEIIFLAGEGGKAVTQNQKDSIRSCVQNASSNSQIASCLNNSSYKPQGGRSGIITVDNEIKTTTLGLLITNTNNTSYTVPSSTFKGKDGNMPSQINQNIIPWSYGYDGGVGGAPFGIRKSNAAASITCGGGMSGTYADTTDIENYVCTSGNINANNARNHDPANNEFGGSGGGGGGVTNDSFEQGQGGNGSSGYLRIRWDASEQE